MKASPRGGCLHFLLDRLKWRALAVETVNDLRELFVHLVIFQLAGADIAVFTAAGEAQRADIRITEPAEKTVTDKRE